MVASNLVIRHTLILTRVVVFEERVVNFVFQRNEVQLFFIYVLQLTLDINVRLRIKF